MRKMKIKLKVRNMRREREIVCTWQAMAVT